MSDTAALDIFTESLAPVERTDWQVFVSVELTHKSKTIADNASEFLTSRCLKNSIGSIGKSRKKFKTSSHSL